MTTKSFELRFLPWVVAAICAVGTGAALAQLAPGALPTGGTVVGGQASIVQNGTTLAITQTSARALVNFSSFNVGSGALVDIRQPGAAAALLARVTGQDASQIYGQIKADGALWLINPAGIMVGQGARIDVGSFIASTLNVSDTDFLAGRLTFTSPGGAGALSNAGTITAAGGGGRIYLVAPKIENTGTLNAPGGEVLLAAAQNVQLVDTGHPGVSIALSGAGGDVRNLGRIVAEAGRIGLGGALVANAGEISASSAVSEGGRIFLRATELKTSATSNIHANGSSGGNVVLAADRADIDGRISATGSGGPGGFVDTSGHITLNVKHAPTVGRGGEWLIDPSDLEVVAGAGGSASVENGVIVSTVNGTTIGAGVITDQLNSGASVVLATGNAGTGQGNIVVNAAIDKTGGADARLTLRAHNDITINAPITSSSGALDLGLKTNFYGNPADPGHAATVNANLNLNGGVLEVSQGEALGNGILNIVGGTTRLDGNAAIQAATVNVGANGNLSIGNSQWVQGAWVNDGVIELRDGDGALNVSGSLVNNGRINLTGSGFFGISGVSDGQSVTNNGTIAKTSGGDQQLTYIGSGAAGRIQVDAGRLTVGDSTVGGHVVVAAGASVVLDGAKIAGGTKFAGPGGMKWAGGVTLLGDVEIGANGPTLTNDPTRLTLVRGPGYQLTTRNSVGIEGTFVLDGDMVWNNHGIVTVGQAQMGNLAFNTNAIFNNRAGGVVDVKDGSRLELSTQTTINNDAGALLRVASTETNSFSGGYQGRLINAGTIVKTGIGTTPATLTNLAGGVLKIDEGGFGVTFSEANANAGTVEIASGAALHSSVDLHNTGTIRGTGSVELGGGPGATLVNSGVVAPGGSDQVGTLTVNGNFTQDAQGALNVRLAGGSADVLRVVGAVRLAGTVNLSTPSGGLPTNGAVADFLVTSGAGATGAFSQVNAPAIITSATTGTLSVLYPASGDTVAQVKASTAPTVVALPPITPAPPPPSSTPAPTPAPTPTPTPTPTPSPPPSADICAIAPNSALCQVLSPPTASEPVMPVVRAAADVLNVLTTTPAATDVKTTDEIALAVSKEVDSKTAAGPTNQTVKKMYCN
ncbi:filamentous hemagglutinin N-terminal domain-containing protein [Variovorax sp. KK3]|uniref:filamentous hemagglutinin N-terminal domain-containing protein n=1 Tax=Variovorax sp. KK3 TaxID=1855728 RepID=UPI00097C3F74|nr:filamentous hemagglutinin N-terminal domain-containing protein [Variovorax sp. KK3]